MKDAPSNNWPVNQAALRWLQAAKISPDPEQSYLIQLAAWGLDENGRVDVPCPMTPSQPSRDDVESLIEALMGMDAYEATQFLMSNANLTRDEQITNVRWQLTQAMSPEEAAQAVVETAYDLMVAESAN